MKEKKDNNTIKDSDNDSVQKGSTTRRNVLKGLATLPVFGVFLAGLLEQRSRDNYKRREILAELGVSEEAPSIVPKTTMKKSGELIRLGIIGIGYRGEQILRAAGFAHPDWIKKESESNNKGLENSLKSFMEKEDLNVAITGICDVFDLHAERGMEIVKSSVRPDESQKCLGEVKRYPRYQDMLQSNEIDAVIVTTPDFQHAQMTIDAVNAGKHVYCEKCMTRTEDEVYKVVDAVKKSNVVFQLGHQYPKNACFDKAKEIIKSNILGKITLVETTSNRNSPNGAWIRHLDSNGNPKPGNPKTIDWNQWLGSRPKVPFSIDRFYNWTKWWDYATGLSGQLMCHEIDAANQLLDLGLPHSCVASGGIYFFKDNREIPDIFHAVYEFPDKDLTFIYSASLANSRSRGRVFMGHDGSMEVGSILTVMADEESTRYKKKIDDGIIDTSLPLFHFKPGQKGIDAVTSASEKFYAKQGFWYTYRDGRRVDITTLHLKEWFEGIRNGSPVSCPIDKGFEVTIACHMATKSYREKRRVRWDPIKRRIV